MIFSNTKLNAVSKEMDFGVLHQIVLGENGRGRKEIRLACPENTSLEVGCNFDYTIGITKSGRPRINKLNDGKVYFLLSSEGGYTRRGCGWIGLWNNNKGEYKVLAKGNGADGIAGRVGYWDCFLIEVVGETPENDWIRIKQSGWNSDSPQWINVTRHGFYFFEDTNDAIAYADMMDIEFPNVDEDVEKTFADVDRMEVLKQC